jgi:hypothetical protein
MRILLPRILAVFDRLLEPPVLSLDVLYGLVFLQFLAAPASANVLEDNVIRRVDIKKVTIPLARVHPRKENSLEPVKKPVLTKNRSLNNYIPQMTL